MVEYFQKLSFVNFFKYLIREKDNVAKFESIRPEQI